MNIILLYKQTTLLLIELSSRHDGETHLIFARNISISCNSYFIKTQVFHHSIQEQPPLAPGRSKNRPSVRSYPAKYQCTPTGTSGSGKQCPLSSDSTLPFLSIPVLEYTEGVMDLLVTPDTILLKFYRLRINLNDLKDM